MTEQEWTDATNLVKVRLAIYSITQTVGSPEERKAALDVLFAWQDRLERVVTTTEDGTGG